jgi:hypothetical protein
MPPRLKLRCLNIALITAFVALAIACGGDPEDPPEGSIEEKLCGNWVSDPIPLLEGDRVDGTTTIEIAFSYWNVGLVASYPDEPALRNRANAASERTRYSACGFKVAGETATSDPSQSGDGSTWAFRVDRGQLDVMYATWVLKNGTKRLDEVKFSKQKK